MTVIQLRHVVQVFLLFSSVSAQISLGGVKMSHGQAVIDLPLQLGLVGGSEEVDGLHIKLDREEVGEIEVCCGILAMETLRELPELSWSGTEQSNRSCGVRALDINTNSLEDRTDH